MKGTFLLILGVAAAAAVVWYWQRNEGKLPALEALGDQGQALSEQAKKVHESVSGTLEETKDRVSDAEHALTK